MSQRKVKILDVFESFLLKYHREDLVDILKKDCTEDNFFIIVNFPTLFEEHMEASDALLDSPMKLLKVFDNAAVKALAKILEGEKLNCPFMTLKLKVHIRLSSLTRCPEIYRDTVPHTSDVNRIICINGTVVRSTSPKMLESQRKYVCLKCKYSFDVFADFSLHYQILKPLRCPNPHKCYSSSFQTKECEKKFVNAKDYQEIKLQEQVQKLVVGTIPRSIWITFEDDLVDSVKPGDDVLICGIVLQRWKSMTRGCRPSIELVVKANNVTVKNKQRSINIVTDENRTAFTEFWNKFRYNPLEGRNTILTSFCPQVYGMYVVKMAVAIVVAGGVQKIDGHGTRVRGESHLLLVGDPGTGKSQFLKYVSNLVPRCVLTTGIGTTNAGLTATAVKEGGEWTLEAGALVLADGGICCIDEFNSVKEHDRAAIHEAMEQQSISVAKAGLVCKLNSRCSILAATNPKGQYDPQEALTVNVALASPLLSRFDLILVLLDSKNSEWDKVVSGFILEGCSPLSHAQNDGLLWSMDLLRTYFCHIRSLQPKMSSHANMVLAKYYRLQRQSNNRNQARTTIRLLESLIRLSQGHARLMMRDEVLTLDAIVAISLMETSMCGASILNNSNPLHMNFPSSARQEYEIEMTSILSKLDLNVILSEEIKALKLDEENIANGSSVVSESIITSASEERKSTAGQSNVRLRNVNKHRFVELEENEKPKSSSLKNYFKKRPRFSDDEDFIGNEIIVCDSNDKCPPRKKKSSKYKVQEILNSSNENDTNFVPSKKVTKKSKLKRPETTDHSEFSQNLSLDKVKSTESLIENSFQNANCESVEQSPLKLDTHIETLIISPIDVAELPADESIKKKPQEKCSKLKLLSDLKRFQFTKSKQNLSKEPLNAKVKFNTNLIQEKLGDAETLVNECELSKKLPILSRSKSLNKFPSIDSTSSDDINSTNVSNSLINLNPSKIIAEKPSFVNKLKQFSFVSSKKSSSSSSSIDGISPEKQVFGNSNCFKATTSKISEMRPNKENKVDNRQLSDYCLSDFKSQVEESDKLENSQYSTSNILSQPVLSLEASIGKFSKGSTSNETDQSSQNSLEQKLKDIFSSHKSSSKPNSQSKMTTWQDEDFDFNL